MVVAPMWMYEPSVDTFLLLLHKTQILFLQDSSSIGGFQNMPSFFLKIFRDPRALHPRSDDQRVLSFSKYPTVCIDILSHH